MPQQHAEDANETPLNQALGRRMYIVIWLIGAALLLGSLAFFFFFAYWAGPPYGNFWQLIAVHLAAGRPGNAALGLEQGFNPWYILYQSCVQDAVVMLFAYPFLLMGYKQAVCVPVVGKRVQKVHAVAAAKKHVIAPYGVAGVVAFVMFPLWGTGPLVGLLMGQLIGLGITTTFVASFTGVVASTAAWIWGYSWLRAYDQQLALYLIITFFAGAVLFTAGYRLYKYLYPPLKDDASLEPEMHVHGE